MLCWATFTDLEGVHSSRKTVCWSSLVFTLLLFSPAHSGGCCSQNAILLLIPWKSCCGTWDISTPDPAVRCRAMEDMTCWRASGGGYLPSLCLLLPRSARRGSAPAAHACDTTLYTMHAASPWKNLPMTMPLYHVGGGMHARWRNIHHLAGLVEFAPHAAELRAGGWGLW